MTSYDPPRVWEIPTPFELEQAMISAAKAIRQALAGLAPGSCFNLAAVHTAFHEVERVGALRRLVRTSEPQRHRPEVAHAYSDYLNALTEWERHLPRLRGWLLAEQARLRSRSNHRDLVRDWMNADRRTR